MYKIVSHARGLKLIEFYNMNNFHVILSNYGASIYQIDSVNKNGETETITLSPKSAYYFDNSKYFGLTVGRVIGRIKDASFTIDNKEYKIEANENGNLLHSGKESFAKKFFEFDIEDYENKTIITFIKNIKDMEDGFPGDLEIKIIYTLFKGIDKMRIDYKAYSNKDTFLNISNHTYFNLSGNLKNDILNQYLTINKEKIVEMYDDLTFKKIVNIPKEYDFRKAKMIGEDIFKEKVKFPVGGYDNCYTGIEPLKIEMYDKESGRLMNIESNYKDCVIYSNNSQSNTSFISDKDDKVYLGLAIEPSRLSMTLSEKGPLQKAHALYSYYIEYTFSVKE